MSLEENSTEPNPMEEMMARLRLEFQETADDRLGEMEELLNAARKGAADDPDNMDSFRRLAHSLKGMGGTFGYPLISVISHRLEDFLEDAEILEAALIDDTQIFLDRMRDVMDGVFEPDDPKTSEIVRALPAKRSAFDISSAKVLDIEVMTVMPKGMTTKIVENELKACGYRVNNVENPFEALQLTVRTKPDMIVTSGILPGLSGVDLACALKAMPATCDIPVLLFTSYDAEHASLVALPDTVSLVRKGNMFSEDLAEALLASGLM